MNSSRLAQSCTIVRTICALVQALNPSPAGMSERQLQVTLAWLQPQLPRRARHLPPRWLSLRHQVGRHFSSRPWLPLWLPAAATLLTPCCDRCSCYGYLRWVVIRCRYF
jgi:hypothetical protein